MNRDDRASARDPEGTEERLKIVTGLCVNSMVSRGLDARTIRGTVLGIATRAIVGLAVDAYEEETHLAVVQRTLDEMLARAGLPA
jgi:hypothetical protein